MDTNVLSSGYLQKIQWIVRDAQTVTAFGAFENGGFYKSLLYGSVSQGLGTTKYWPRSRFSHVDRELDR